MLRMGYHDDVDRKRVDTPTEQINGSRRTKGTDSHGSIQTGRTFRRPRYRSRSDWNCRLRQQIET